MSRVPDPLDISLRSRWPCLGSWCCADRRVVIAWSAFARAPSPEARGGAQEGDFLAPISCSMWVHKSAPKSSHNMSRSLDIMDFFYPRNQTPISITLYYHQFIGYYQIRVPCCIIIFPIILIASNYKTSTGPTLELQPRTCLNHAQFHKYLPLYSILKLWIIKINIILYI